MCGHVNVHAQAVHLGEHACSRGNVCVRTQLSIIYFFYNKLCEYLSKRDEGKQDFYMFGCRHSKCHIKHVRKESVSLRQA